MRWLLIKISVTPLLQSLPFQAPRAPGGLQGSSAQGPEPRRQGGLLGLRGLRTSLPAVHTTRSRGMEHSEGAPGDPAGTVVPQELLEEMLWFFRVEDASPWNHSILALAAVVVMISMFLLGRSIQASRKQKMQPPEKENPEVLHLDEARTKDHNNLNNLRETLLSEKPNSAQVELELKERDVLSVFLPDIPETES
ncbi:organic solute transporter subunit beta isoform X1 [Papio anubis]|nr:organic solute transporter subunit beta isoform X1 [Papio anubis]